MPSLHVASVERPSDDRAFALLPFALYRDDPNWVAPLRSSELQRWSPAHNATLRTRSTARFLVWRDGRVVGRIAAMIDPAFTERWAPATGFFGFFECADDAEASAALFDAAHDWLRSMGMVAVLGPVNLSTNEEVGLLVDGFGAPPMLLSPYNPPRYMNLVRDAGYLPARDYHAYRWTPDVRPTPAVERLAAAARRRAGNAGRVRVRPANPRTWMKEIRTLFTLYNAAFDAVWGFVPMTWEEFSAKAEEFRPFYRPELALIAEVDGEVVGFGLVLPDINAALRGIHGRLLPFGWLRLMWTVPRLRTGRFMLTGVLPAHTGRGVAPLIAYEMAEAGRKIGMREVELSLVQQSNAPMRHVIEAFGCPRNRTFRLYQRAIGA